MLGAGQDIYLFLQQHGYWIMLPLMIIEGPIVTVVAAMLSSLGAFNIYVVFVLSIMGDVVGDVIFYFLGYIFGLRFVKNFGKYIGVTEKLVDQMEKYFIRHGGKTIFAVKATTGLCWATFTAAGIIKMRFYKFIKYSLLGGFVWSGFLVAMGYFYGYLWREITVYIEWVGWIIFVLTVMSIIVISFYKKQRGKKIFLERL
ncbi:hypothetical protein C0584_03595 [Candidatus Parcubacteria bacterium]|nr:MAG: hypothetical protein C0584_03595 [Candidatus Parcubacteria bacterium]